MLSIGYITHFCELLHGKFRCAGQHGSYDTGNGQSYSPSSIALLIYVTSYRDESESRSLEWGQNGADGNTQSANGQKKGCFGLDDVRNGCPVCPGVPAPCVVFGSICVNSTCAPSRFLCLPSSSTLTRQLWHREQHSMSSLGTSFHHRM